jgi:hypothetical protein
MTNKEITEFMQLWSRLARGTPEEGESMSQLLESFADALSFQLVETIHETENGQFAVAYIEHGELSIYRNVNALIFCIRCDSDDEALDLYSSIKSVVYGRELTGQPAAVLILKSNPTFDAYCNESPVAFVRFPSTRIAGVFRDSKPRDAFARRLRELADADVVNPYSTAGPVVGSMFFGRRSELQMITKPEMMSFNGRRSFALLGSRQSGKSSILLNARQRLQGLENIHVEYIDCYPYQTADRVMYEIATRLQPRAAKRWTSDKFSHFLFSMQRGKRDYVLLLDETDIIAQHDALTGDRLFGSLAGEPGFRFVVAGHLGLRKVTRDLQGKLFNVVELIHLGGIEEPSARSLIVDPMTDVGLNLHDAKDIITHILFQSARRPAIIQLYCHELVNRAKQYGRIYVDTEDIKAVEHNYAFRERVLDSFLIDTTPLSRFIGLLLLEYDQQGMTEEQLYEAVSAEKSDCKLPEVQDGIALLEEPGLIEPQGQSLHFAFPAFPRLLRELHNLQFLKQETLKELKHDRG